MLAQSAIKNEKSKESHTADTLKVSSFNLFNYLAPPNAYYDFDRIYSQAQWDKKEAWIKNFLAKRQPDIIGFQEVFSVEALQALVQSQGYSYFATVDTPTVIDEFIYRDPVVALASKYPISEIKAVKANSALAIKLGLTDTFTFSRKILRATVALPHIGSVDCYVVHFKSKRAAFEHQESSALTSQENLLASLTNEISGRWASSIQRGSEATLLMNEIITRRAASNNAVLMMGDFNNELNDGVLKQLSFEDDLPRHIDNEQVTRYRLRDTWQVYCESDSYQRKSPDKKMRAATHYWNGKGSVLDYLLCSFEFDTSHQSSLYDIENYQVDDKQLINPSFDVDDLSTDHGVITVTFNLRQ